MTGRYAKPSPVEEVQESSIYTYWKEALVRQKCQFGTNNYIDIDTVENDSRNFFPQKRLY